MKQYVKQYLLLTYLISYLCFGLPLYLRWDFPRMLAEPLGLLLFALGALGPALAAGLVFCLHQKALGGLAELWRQVRLCGQAKSWALIPAFLLLHYGLGLLLRLVQPYDPPARYLGYLLPVLLLFGSRELGWRLILEPALQDGRKFWKSSAAAGLFDAIWFLPLVLMKDFVVRADYFLQFALYLVGLHVLLATLRRKGGSVLACCLLSGIFFAFMTLFQLRQSNMLLALPVVDALICFLYSSRSVKENQPHPL